MIDILDKIDIAKIILIFGRFFAIILTNISLLLFLDSQARQLTQSILEGYRP
jgi:hypothetical protein